ncbi:MAG: redoxin domain-containing protein [Lachnospiraceae bacterium]|nr:redoxin domain-containing protein [Lachnospiraceae bacterium]
MAKLNPGDRFPDFTVTTQFEDNTSISKIAGGKPLMLVVLRYIGCPSCRYDVHMLQVNYEKFVEKGVQIAVVMQSTPESIRKSLADEPLSFPIICDPDYAIYNELEIRPAANREEMMGSEEVLAKFMKKREAIQELGYAHGEYEGIEEQLPAFFFMDAELNLTAAHYAKGIGDMPTAEEMLTDY